MTTMTPMVEYLLALRKPGDGQLVRYGAIQVTIPVFPPGISLTWQLTPYYGAYASIQYWYRFSPAIVPNAFTFSSAHSGTQLLAGPIGLALTSESHNTWIEITERNPITITITNVSGINQFFENLEAFLIIDSEENLEIVREVVRNWGGYEPVAAALRETNQLLRQLIGGPPVPRPPIR